MGLVLVANTFHGHPRKKEELRSAVRAAVVRPQLDHQQEPKDSGGLPEIDLELYDPLQER